MLTASRVHAWEMAMRSNTICYVGNGGHTVGEYRLNLKGVQMFVSRTVAAVALISTMLGATGPSFAEAYKLGPGDKLRISVYQWDVLNNIYTVDPAGTISLPIVGTVPVSGEDTGKIGGTISKLLATKLKLAEAPTTSVEITQFRPFSVLGDVAKPGDYPYRPGMIVLDALAIAGGYYRPAEAQAIQVRRSAILDRGKLDDDTSKLRRLYAQKLRLQAAADGRATLDPQKANEGLSHSGADADLLQQEAAILASQQAEISSQTSAFDNSVELLTQEIVKRQAHVVAIQDELRGLMSEASNVRDLVGKGMSTTARETSLDVMIADVKRSQFEIETSVLRARQEIKDDIQKRDALRLEFRNKNLLELREVDAKIEELNSEVETVRQNLEKPATGDGRVIVTIVRRGDQSLTKMRVQELDPVEPGDILTFERKTGENLSDSAKGTN